MRNKNQLTNDLNDCKTVRRTMTIMSHNRTLVEGLRHEFVLMVENLKVDLLASLNHKEYQDPKFDRIKSTDIDGDYIDAYIVYGDIYTYFRENNLL